ncbi:hypothetical protein GSI_05353 [Ganoderma sinense ZZ0214-1]|uniref:Uncharacterized protein n=1 Tax=Ganoderma sinense ZZ0214-1 TaxID=1077348 RepID=A0A2G8SFV4_9APHY|nr:hypothetical protein GSI_05353 [Ganoderma sinense ZZ0214-1]
MSLVRIHVEDAVQYSLGPELDDSDGNEPDIPPEEFQRLHPDTHSTLFGMHIVDSILKYLDAPIMDANRQLINVDYLRDSQGRRTSV